MTLRKTIVALLLCLTVLMPAGTLLGSPATSQPTSAPDAARYMPPWGWAVPFAVLLLTIAIAPITPGLSQWWHHNRNKLLVSVVLSVPVIIFYGWVHPAAAVHEGDHFETLNAGGQMLTWVLQRTLLHEYLPFILLLFSLYTISGGIRLRGDLAAHPMTNTAFLGVGAALASFIGTTGAAMLLIRPLLHTNAERKHVRHTVVFFIFLVCNVGGCLLPIGDPPLFLGYLLGVPFAWTFHLAPEWAVLTLVLLVVYYVWDSIAYRKEEKRDIRRDETAIEPLRLDGKLNFVYLLGVVAAVAFLVPGRQPILAPHFTVPENLREIALLLLACASLATTPAAIRQANRFTFSAIAEVAVLFLGIFITMQVAIEMLQVSGPRLGLSQPWHFFWATGALSSFLDNAPTYVVFFHAADSMTQHGGTGILTLLNGHFIREDLLAAISLGAVFMGANTYIGNGPNFMVKAIAEQRGIPMPSFFGYMLYSLFILLPLFVVMTFIFFR